jgi:formylmethanofuran dehydrogenase subunit B
MWNNLIEQTMASVTCPGCGLGCDDLTVTLADGQLKSLENGCEKAYRFFDSALNYADSTPMIDGSAATLDDALARSTQLLKESNSPLFTGLATDVNGMRSLLAIADRCGGTLDHLNGDALFRNLRVLQDSGWFTTTFTEVRNRADLVVLIGDQSLQRFPRLLDRLVLPNSSLFTETRQRKIVLLGAWTHDTLPSALASLNPLLIPAGMDQLSDAIALLRGLIAGKTVSPERLGKPVGDALRQLADWLKQAKYSVISWSAAELDIAHAELTIQGMAELVKELNETTRSAALPLAGSLADITCNQVCTWQLGYPLRTRLQRGYPEHDPILNRWQDLLVRGESDLLIWVSSLSPEQIPPHAEIPAIVLGHPGMKLDKPPSVYIPVGVPGVDHRGHWYRSDSVCPLPLGKMRESHLPSVANLMEQIDARLKSTTDQPARASLC